MIKEKTEYQKKEEKSLRNSLKNIALEIIARDFPIVPVNPGPDNNKLFVSYRIKENEEKAISELWGDIQAEIICTSLCQMPIFGKPYSPSFDYEIKSCMRYSAVNTLIGDRQSFEASTYGSSVKAQRLENFFGDYVSKILLLNKQFFDNLNKEKYK